MLLRLSILGTLFIITMSVSTFAKNDLPPIEKGVSQTLAKWRAANYSDVRYKLNLTIEKNAPTLKGSIEVRVNIKSDGRNATVNERVNNAITDDTLPNGRVSAITDDTLPNGRVSTIILDWRKIKGHEGLSKISSVLVNGKTAKFEELNEHLIFKNNIKTGENIIKLDFESPILTSGGAITRYIDKEDGAEYIYSLFVPSDASTAFPVFDQPDLKARFQLRVRIPWEWRVISNAVSSRCTAMDPGAPIICGFEETKPISTYVFAFAAGEFAEFEDQGRNATVKERVDANQDSSETKNTLPDGRVSALKKNTLPDGRVSALKKNTLPNGRVSAAKIYVRKSQAEKFKSHAEEVFRLNRESIKYLEDYFDYEFPFPKYDLVLIPEFPFGGMEHAGSTFLRESSIIFPTEPTANNYISRANLIFHENAHQWFGDTVTMKWFDDLWLKEGFATFMAYKAMEKVLPQYNAWKVFYERTKPLAYQTDSTRGTTPIYQEIPNLNSAKSAYGNIVYQKAPGFLKQAEFYLGADNFQSAVRSFLKKNEYGNAEWSDLVDEFENAVKTAKQPSFFDKSDLREWADYWVKQRGVSIIRINVNKAENSKSYTLDVEAKNILDPNIQPRIKFMVYSRSAYRNSEDIMGMEIPSRIPKGFRYSYSNGQPYFIFPNYQDYGYGIFLLDEKSKKYILENIQNEKDDFLRSMMWGSLWDSVRFAELDPKDYVELAIKNIGVEEDVSTISSILARVETAMTYYIPKGRNATVKERADTNQDSSSTKNTLPNGRVSARSELALKLENLLIEKMQTAKTQGERITFYRSLLGIASSENAKGVLKDLLAGRNPTVRKGAEDAELKNFEKIRKTKEEVVEIYKDKDGIVTSIGNESAKGVDSQSSTSSEKNAPFLTVGFLPLRTKDKFDIVTRLIILGDKDAPILLAELEKTETDDAAKRYAYAAKAGFATKENKAKYWNDFTNNKELSESWIEEALDVWNSPSHSELTLPYLEKALAELPNHKQNRKIFFVNGWVASFIGGQKSEAALEIINKFLKDNPNLDIDLQRKILERLDGLERAVKIREKYGQ